MRRRKSSRVKHSAGRLRLCSGPSWLARGMRYLGQASDVVLNLVDGGNNQLKRNHSFLSWTLFNYNETEAKKRKLQKYMQKKLKLMAEVKFLRKKYNSFTRNSSQEAPFRLKKLPRKKPSPSVTFVHPEHSINNANGNANHPLQEENHRAKETETPATSALFDLNKVSFSNAEEMEGIQVEWEPLKVDKLKRCSADGEVAAGRDLNLSIFKDVGNSSSHVGKRKISWQDQVALRV